MTTKSDRRIQTAYEEARHDLDSQSLRDRIGTAMFRYLVEDLGLAESAAQTRAEKEVSGIMGRAVCEELAELGIIVSGKSVLDLGAGLGGLSVELARRGGHVVGLEPGTGWCKIASERLNEIGAGGIVAGVGEAMPLASESVDVIVSLQVLEHVQHPKQVVQEAFRVLKPGGYFYLAYENYFSFWEPHYRVFWLPLLPKSLGSAYLRWRGRNPRFLQESVTYTTFHAVRKILSKAGFKCLRRQKSAELLQSPSTTSLKWRILKRLGSLSQSGTLNLIAAVDHSNRLMRTAVYECMRKPSR